MAYASLLRPQQRHSHIPELICGFNNSNDAKSRLDVLSRRGYGILTKNQDVGRRHVEFHRKQ